MSCSGRTQLWPGWPNSTRIRGNEKIPNGRWRGRQHVNWNHEDSIVDMFRPSEHPLTCFSKTQGYQCICCCEFLNQRTSHFWALTFINAKAPGCVPKSWRLRRHLSQICAFTGPSNVKKGVRHMMWIETAASFNRVGWILGGSNVMQFLQRRNQVFAASWSL